MYLIDTNIFLEILLQQEKSANCKNFLDDNMGFLNLTDFTLHSIGVILFRQSEERIFIKFIEDMLPAMNIRTLPPEKYKNLARVKKDQNLDFNDAYHYMISKPFDLKFVTMDQDFKNIKDVEIQFL